MTTTSDDALEREEIERLLPWHAAGTLSRRDAQRVEQALAQDTGLARQYALVREELSETIHLNETLGAPSARAMERLLAGIEAESGPVRQTRRGFSFGAWMSEQMAALSPRTLAWSATAAALAIALQTGLLASIYMGDRANRDSIETASKQPTTQTGSGSFALISFAPTATAADITNFLAANKFTIVDGPRPGGAGMYRVRLAATVLPRDEIDRLVTRLQAEGAIVRSVLPTQ